MGTVPRFGGLPGATGVGCGGLVFCHFGAGTPPELMKKHGFLNAFEGIRGRPVGTHARARDVKRFTFFVV